MKKNYYKVSYSVWGAPAPRVEFFHALADALAFVKNRDYCDNPRRVTITGAPYEIADIDELIAARENRIYA